MLLSKQISKLRKKNGDRKPKPPKPLRIKDPNKNLRCRYVPIPQPSKLLYKDPVYCLNGDIFMINSNDKIWTEVSFLNEYKNYRDVMIQEMYGQRVVVIKPTCKPDQKTSNWKELIHNLKHENNEEMSEWAKIIEVYCHKYSKVMMRQSRKKLKSDCRKKFFAEVTADTEQQTHDLFQASPCIKLKYRLKNHAHQVSEIIVSESLIVEAGYDIETFVSLVLNEGIPQMFCHDDMKLTANMKGLLEQYFTLKEAGNKWPVYDSRLLMRNNLAKNIKRQSFCLMNYEINTFGLDVIITVSQAEEPEFIKDPIVLEKLNPEFVQNMVVREVEADSFLSQYYNFSLRPTYTNIEKVCTIKELKVMEEEYDDSIIVKKDEDI